MAESPWLAALRSTGGRTIDEQMKLRNALIFREAVFWPKPLAAIGRDWALSGERVRQIIETERRRLKHLGRLGRAHLARPIELGGQRDTWIESTPEDVQRETEAAYA